MLFPQEVMPDANIRRRTKRQAKLEAYVDNPYPTEDVISAPPGLLQICWPTVFGVLLAILSLTIWDKVADHWGNAGLRFVFPFVLLIDRSLTGFSPELTRGLQDIFVFLQFPLEGLVVSWNLRQRRPLIAAVPPVVFVHLLVAFVLLLMA